LKQLDIEHVHVSFYSTVTNLPKICSPPWFHSESLQFVALITEASIYIEKIISHISRKLPIELLTSNTFPFSREAITTRSEFVERGLFAMRQNSRHTGSSFKSLSPHLKCQSLYPRNAIFAIFCLRFFFEAPVPPPAHTGFPTC
jgi:hypothetical protein